MQNQCERGTLYRSSMRCKSQFYILHSLRYKFATKHTNTCIHMYYSNRKKSSSSRTAESWLPSRHRFRFNLRPAREPHLHNVHNGCKVPDSYRKLFKLGQSTSSNGFRINSNDVSLVEHIWLAALVWRFSVGWCRMPKCRSVAPPRSHRDQYLCLILDVVAVAVVGGTNHFGGYFFCVIAYYLLKWPKWPKCKTANCFFTLLICFCGCALNPRPKRDLQSSATVA